MDECTPLIRSSGRPEDDPERLSEAKVETKSGVDMVFFVIAILGVFLAIGDEYFVFTTSGHIASDFHRLSLGPWLITAYNLGYSVTLPLYGRVCEIYGYKTTLLVAYLVFTLGCVISGLAPYLGVAIAGRFIAGAGGAGMTDLISVIITEMAPLREVAVLRCYIQMSGTVGVTVGSPLGGLLTDLLGWRWSFLIKVPLGLFCFAMAAWRLPSATNNGYSDMKEGGEVDDEKPELNLPGISLLGTVIAAIMGVCQLLSEELPQKDILMTLAIATVVIGGVLFGLNERYWAKTALVPMYLLKTNGIGLAYIAQFLAMFTFCGFSSNFADFWVRTKNASASLAALSILPLAAASTVSGLIVGNIVRRTGKYKSLSIKCCMAMILGNMLLVIRLPQAPYYWEILFTIIIGVGMGGFFSVTFVGLSASIPNQMSATAMTVYYLAQQLGMMMGITATSVTCRMVFKEYLERKLADFAGSIQIIHHVLSDSRFGFSLPEPLQTLVKDSFFQAFRAVPVMTSISMVLVLPILCYLPERSLE
ncbi:transporter [Penicillium subrubescens]|uniref:transporter n=1 Tax=Penicillium subrubescens TaxID=1316194 RepID=UPI0025454AB5|nr:transporter [Penicillium subrubescens]KAJ5880815.1 transporter [Penicillium subrubescens]